MDGKYNLKSPAVKRLMREAAELKEPTDQYFAQPVDDNLFEWHFTVRGPQDSEFDSGIYHGRITLPAEYPMKPPSIMLLTPNGRFELGTKICLSISGHHPETWRPSWSIRTALLAIIGFMPTKGAGAIGALDYTTEERRVLAVRSLNWTCETCGKIANLVAVVRRQDDEMIAKTKREIEEIASQISFHKEKQKTVQTAVPGGDSAPGSSKDLPERPRTVSDHQTEPPTSSGPSTATQPKTPGVATTPAPRSPDRSPDTVLSTMILLTVVLLAVLIGRRMYNLYDGLLSEMP